MKATLLVIGVTATLLVVCSATPSFAAGPERLNGTWELDRSNSDSSEALMKALEVSWAMRQIGKIANVSLELTAKPAACETCAEEIHVVQHTPISSDEIRIILDNAPRPGKDPRGRPTIDRYSWTAERGVEMIRKFELPSGREARLHEMRKLGDEPDTMISTLVASVDGVEKASVRRLYRRNKK